MRWLGSLLCRLGLHALSVREARRLPYSAAWVCGEECQRCGVRAITLDRAFAPGFLPQSRGEDQYRQVMRSADLWASRKGEWP